VILAAAAPAPADVTTAALTADEQKQLEALDPSFAQECVQLAQQEASLVLADKEGYRGEAIGTGLFVFEATAKTGAGTPKGPTPSAAQAFFLPADQVKVPAVTRETVAAATAALLKVGLRGMPLKNAGVKDLVLKQEPAAGTWRAPGSAVELSANLAAPDKPMKPR
jgi:hypothetical protein